MRKYTVILEYDLEAKAYAVTVPALPGCTSQGDTIPWPSKSRSVATGWTRTTW